MSYVVVTTEPYRQAATYVDRIFKSGKPAELPVEASARFELVIIRPADDILDPVQQDRNYERSCGIWRNLFGGSRKNSEENSENKRCYANTSYDPAQGMLLKGR